MIIGRGDPSIRHHVSHRLHPGGIDERTRLAIPAQPLVDLRPGAPLDHLRRSGLVPNLEQCPVEIAEGGLARLLEHLLAGLSFRLPAIPGDRRIDVFDPVHVLHPVARLRKIIKTRGHFPTDDAANKLIWLALRNITADWGKAAHHWKEAMNQFAILYDDRFNAAG